MGFLRCSEGATTGKVLAENTVEGAFFIEKHSIFDTYLEKKP